MREVLGWVLRHDYEPPLSELEPGSLAHDVLSGIKHTADRERASIFSTAARVLRAYRSETALSASEDQNFDPEAFCASTDTVYIAASAHEQRLLAPLVVGLLAEIRETLYRLAFAHGRPPVPLLYLLDECANIAPLPDLPAMLSEGGGQGLHSVSVLQDMSQARRRWGKDADGMLSLFGAMVVMSGIADKQTLEQLSLICGEWDRPVQTITEQHSGLFSGASTSEAWTTRRERRLPPDEIAQLPQGQALVMIGPNWQILPTLPYQLHPTFAHLTNGIHPVIDGIAHTTPTPGPHPQNAPDGGAVTEQSEGKGAGGVP
jgi:type IV secretory pathway TraG/TraD family ATPase VirD4